MRLSASDNAILTMVVQSKQASEALHRSPIQGGVDPMPDALGLLPSLSEEAQAMGRIIVGELGEEDVPRGLFDAAQAFESRLQG